MDECKPLHTGTANVALSSSSVNAFPRPNRAHAPRAQELYQPMWLDSVPSAKPNSLNLGRGPHSSRFQLNLSSSVHRVTQLNS